ncbi:MAG TPA: hypothetical protein VJT74_05355 [Pyrinomonadaceae bacterium]|nr:hypothetical protein [Pyrinomonadaceae bacterium]
MTTQGTHSSDFSEYLKGLAVSGDSSKAEVVLLTCMDFRFFERVSKYMDDAGLTGKYYHLILAGAALGAVVPKEPADPEWHKTFFDHLKLARTLDPQITRVIVLEHRGCKAYEKFDVLVPPYTDGQERDAHDKQVAQLRTIIVRQYGLPVESFLLSLEKRAADDEGTLTFDQLL